MDEKTGFSTRSVLCVPVPNPLYTEPAEGAAGGADGTNVGHEAKTLAVMQVGHVVGAQARRLGGACSGGSVLAALF
jgi:hypothetical protein